MIRTWHMTCAWMEYPGTSGDPDGDAHEESVSVEAESLEAARAILRPRYPYAAIDLDWVAWEPWPGLVLEISDYPAWETVHDGPWTGHESIFLRDAAPLPEGLERESARITAEKIGALTSGTQAAKDQSPHDREPRIAGWRVEGEPGDRWLRHPSAVTLVVDAKSLGDDHASCLAHPRVRSIVAGPHPYAPILGLDESGEVVCVTIGRKA